MILIGRLTRDPEIRHAASGDKDICIANYTLAVDRRYKRDGEQSADFPRCVTFGKAAEFAEKYFRQGTKIAVVGRIQTGSYTDREGRKVYTTDVVVEEQEFAESKKASESNSGQAAQASQRPPVGTPQPAQADTGFMEIPDGIDEDLPFN